MVPRYLPTLFTMALHKGEFCYCVGISAYKLKNLIKQHERELARMGYSKFDKILMPTVVSYLLHVSGLKIEENRLAECMGYAPCMIRGNNLE